MALALRIEKNFVRTEKILRNLFFSLVSIFLPEFIFSNNIPFLPKNKGVILYDILYIIGGLLALYFITKLVKNIIKRYTSIKDDNKVESLLERKNIIEDNFGTHEVEVINAFGNEVIGGNHLPDASIIEQRRKKSPNVIKTISIVEGRSKKLVGYYVLYPLTEEITQDILKGDILNAKQLQLKDITMDFSNAYSMYIGMLLGENISSKASIEKILERDIKQYLHKNNKIKYIFAKPASSDGHRIVSQNGFSNINNSEIKYLEILS